MMFSDDPPRCVNCKHWQMSPLNRHDLLTGAKFVRDWAACHNLHRVAVKGGRVQTTHMNAYCSQFEKLIVRTLEEVTHRR